MRPQKKFIVEEITKSISMKQEIEEPIMKYLHRLRKPSRYCESEIIRLEEETI